MQLFRLAEQHDTRNAILAQGSHSQDPTGAAGESQPSFAILFSQLFNECLTTMARSAAVRSSHQRTERQVIGAQPPLGSDNQALRNEVSRSTVVDGQVSNAIADGIEFEEVEIEGAAVASVRKNFPQMCLQGVYPVNIRNHENQILNLFRNFFRQT